MDTHTFIKFKDQEVPVLEIIDLVLDVKNDYSNDCYGFDYSVEEDHLLFSHVTEGRQYELTVYLNRLKNLDYLHWVDKHLFTDIDMMLGDVWGPSN